MISVPARAILSKGIPVSADRCRLGDAELMGNILTGIEQSEKRAASAHARARFGSNADLAADEAQAEEEMAERYRDVARDIFGITFPGLDPSRFARLVFP
jgi:hypothetical protein